MKNTVLLFVLPGILMLSSCDKINQKDDQCEANKWDQPREATFLFRSINWHDTFVVGLDDATEACFRARIYKTYCNGNTSGDFSFEINYDIETLQQALESKSLSVFNGTQYIYKFEHDDDFVTITGELEVNELGEETVYYPVSIICKGEQINALYGPLSQDGMPWFFDGTFEGSANDNLELIVSMQF